MSNEWYQNAVFYGVDVRRFKDSNGDGYGDFQGLISKLDYLVNLGVEALWLLPFYDSPLHDNGYDVRDYYRVDPRAGTLEDFIALVQAAKERHIRILMDLVMNHTSDEHPWFQASRQDPDSGYRDYYIWTKSPPLVPPDEAPVFPGEDNQVWTYDSVAGAYYFHRFYHFQPDLRTGNPAVQEEIRKVMDFWLSFGVAGFRIDAEPLMLQEKGLASTLMKDPHKVIREIHQFARSRLPDAVLLGEANVPLDQITHYFGGGKEMTMLLNFIGDAHLFLAFARQNATPMMDYFRSDPRTPQNGQWLNFLRNFDELTLDQLPAEQRQVVMEALAPDPKVRIYDRGIRQRLAPLLDGDPQRIKLAFSLVFSMPGDALIMYGDELGMGDDLALPGRDAVRTPMQWSNAINGEFSTSDRLIAPVISQGPYGYQKINASDQMANPDSLLNWMKGLINLRRWCPEIGLQLADLIETEKINDCLLIHAFAPLSVRPDEGAILFAHNLSSKPQQAVVPVRGVEHSPRAVFGEVEGMTLKEPGKLSVNLPGYGFAWARIPDWQPKTNRKVG